MESSDSKPAGPGTTSSTAATTTTTTTDTDTDTDTDTITGTDALAAGGEPDWSVMTAAGLAAFQEAENRRRSAPAARAVTGEPDAGAEIGWRRLDLPGRTLPVRVYRPVRAAGAHEAAGALPLVIHVHGGGFVGTAVQSDWVNSHLAAQLPALVVSVEHRLLGFDVPLSSAIDDGVDVLDHLLRHDAEWDFDPARVAVFGESCGGLIAAMTAIRARDGGTPLRAQVLVNTAADVTERLLEEAQASPYANSPTLTVGQLRFFHRLAVPEGTDARALSPAHAADLSGLPPTLVVVPTHDPIAEQGRAYAARLWSADTPVRVTEYPGAVHAFLSIPGMPALAASAGSARAAITDFLRGAL